MSELSSSDWFDSNDPYGYEVKPNAANWLYDPDDNRKFVCNCGRTYKSKGSLTDHQRWECGKSPTFQVKKYFAKIKEFLIISRFVFFHFSVHIANIKPNGKNICDDMLFVCIRKNLMNKTICDLI